MIEELKEREEQHEEADLMDNQGKNYQFYF